MRATLITKFSDAGSSHPRMLHAGRNSVASKAASQAFDLGRGGSSAGGSRPSPPHPKDGGADWGRKASGTFPVRMQLSDTRPSVQHDSSAHGSRLGDSSVFYGVPDLDRCSVEGAEDPFFLMPPPQNLDMGQGPSQTGQGAVGGGPTGGPLLPTLTTGGPSSELQLGAGSTSIPRGEGLLG